jgi:hypothetical protein
MLCVLQAGPEHPRRLLDVQSEKARDHDDNDYYADDIKNIHCLAPIKECATVEIASTLSSVQRRQCVSVPDQIVRDG